MSGRYKSFSDLCDLIDDHIGERRFDQALRTIHRHVDRVVSEPVLVAQVYGSDELDKRCQEVGRISFHNLGVAPTPREDEDRLQGHNVYVVSKLQTSGGHTKVIKDFIAARPTDRHTIFSTEVAGVSELGTVNSTLANGELATFEAAPNSSHWERLQWLQATLLKTNPSRVYLFNHHQDSVAVAAVVPEMGIPTTFYHHGDHHLCLGVFLRDVEHIDPHPMGYCNCRSILKIENRFIPLIAEDRATVRSEFLEDGYLTTCTAARSNKIEIPYYVNYLDVVPEILRRTKGKHIHIGHLTPWALRRIRRGLSKYGISQDRFVYIPWVSSVWQALIDHKVDLYIASFPYGGGLTLIEAMGAGTPVALHRHMYSRILSGLSLGYPSAFNWHKKEDLIEYCGSLDRDALARASNLSRMHYHQYHRAEVLASALNGKLTAQLVPSTKADEAVEIDTDEWSQWLLNNMSLTNIICQRVIRILKRLRTSWIRLNKTLSEIITKLKMVR